LIGQNRSDYQWLFSNDYTDSLDGFEGSIMDFNSGKLEIREQNRFLHLDVVNQNICDEETGELLFYSNGCTIANREDHVMLNGDSLNFNLFYEDWCGADRPYPLMNGMIILRKPLSEFEYYAIHQFYNYDQNFNIICGLNFSLINMNGDSGLGEVINKNLELEAGGNVSCGYTTACQSPQGHWWIIQITESFNEYLIYKLTSDGLEFHHSQILGNASIVPSGTGQATFSPNGKYFVWFSPYGEINVLEFDRNNGTFVSHTNYDFPPNSDFTEFTGSVFFSSNSNLLYVSTDYRLFQLNLLDSDPELKLISLWDGFVDPLPVTFTSGLLGPDCRIYVIGGAGTKHFGVIHSPNEIGENCDFRQHENSLVWHKSRGFHPFFPHYRINEDQPCDDTLTPTAQVINTNYKTSTFPNPVKDKLNLDFSHPLKKESVFNVYNLDGRPIYSTKLKQRCISKQIEITTLSSGMYIWKIQNGNGIMETGKFFKID